MWFLKLFLWIYNYGITCNVGTLKLGRDKRRVCRNWFTIGLHNRNTPLDFLHTLEKEIFPKIYRVVYTKCAANLERWLLSLLFRSSFCNIGKQVLSCLSLTLTRLKLPPQQWILDKPLNLRRIHNKYNNENVYYFCLHAKGSFLCMSRLAICLFSDVIQNDHSA